MAQVGRLGPKVSSHLALSAYIAWTLTMTKSWWLHHKHCFDIIIIIIIVIIIIYFIKNTLGSKDPEG